ncbi:unnamed protein product [Cercopithifilaria johnstoni]|uniref:Ground-like domain-containing protein n=1 Tax=Cercopithifilaria johnstoni TaxID=2874296 RepID=A0A8J2QAD3_9BILA|nr:unnamed protein product [Cercopithifilaria johnstoni]
MFNYMTVLLTFQFSLFGLLKASCNCPQCPPCTVQICPPVVVCQPIVCPAPPVCPVLLPRSCPVCVKPIVKSVLISVVNKCCKTCDDYCTMRLKRNISNDTMVTVNSVCNNKMLGEIIAKKMTLNPATSQKLIMKSVTKLLGQYNVFCSTGNLTYVAYTNDFCQVDKSGVVCYAFKTL